MVRILELDERDVRLVCAASPKVREAQRDGNNIVLFTVDEAALDGGRVMRRIGVMVTLRNGFRCVAEEFDYGAVAEIELVGLREIGDGSERDDAAGIAIGGEAQGEMTTGRVAENDDAVT